MKKIGIITMHKVYNYGSALQAYALQTYIEEINPEEYRCEIIDYRYPNRTHSFSKTDKTVKKLVKVIRFDVFYLLKELLNFSRNKKFRSFWKTYFHLSKSYSTADSIKQKKLPYDLLVTGSDQVWNPRYTKFDSVFMCDFSDNNVSRISFGPAIGQKKIEPALGKMLQTYVGNYKYISIRDKSVEEELRTLLNKDVSVVCDPTLLLNSKQWNTLANKSRFSTKQGYILLYILRYSFDPYPDVVSFINNIRDDLKLPVITLYANKIVDIKNDYREIKNADCYDFLALIKNAECIITTSFHGTCFSINYRKPFYSIVDDTTKDSRIHDLLDSCGLENRMIKLKDINQDFIYSNVDYDDTKINSYIDLSKNYLTNAIGDCI